MTDYAEILKKYVDEAPKTDLLPDINCALACVQIKEYERNEKIKNREAYIARELNSYIKKIESHQDYLDQEKGAA